MTPTTSKRYRVIGWRWLARLVAPIVLVLTPILLTSCGSDDGAEKGDAAALAGGASGERARYGNLTREGMNIQTADLNQDGEPDQWKLSSGGLMQRIERDLNFDGDVDLWQYPDENLEIVEEEMDLDHDGNVDVVVYYTNGVVTRKEMSIDFEGRFSIVKFYDKNGDLLRVERDEDGDGSMDVWEYYENKQRVRIGWDESGDGQPDRFDTLE